MAKPTLEEIKAKADEYVKLMRRVERAENARDTDQIILSYEKKLDAARGKYDVQISRLQAKADELRAEVVAWMSSRKVSWSSESELAEFGVKVGVKELERQPDKQKLWNLCKKKGVEFFELITVSLAAADKALGRKEVDAISTKRTKETRDEYLRVKE